MFVAELGRLKLKETSSIAVCLMTGIVTECAIVSEGWTGPDNEKVVHKISIAPFRQEFRRDTTMWGKILNFDNISCAISTEGMSFTTKPRTLSAPLFSSPGMFLLQFFCKLFYFIVFRAFLSENPQKRGFLCFDCCPESCSSTSG